MRCWYTRWQMSNALERGDLASRMTRGHAARCAACQAFGAALESLHDRLSRGAHAAAAPVVAPVVARRTRWPLLVGGPVAAGATAIALAVGMGGAPGPAVDGPPPVPAQASRPLRVDRVATLITQVFANTPLETELDALIHDGRRGLDVVLATGGLRWPRASAEDRQP